jgi:hypothetical protein
VTRVQHGGTNFTKENKDSEGISIRKRMKIYIQKIHKVESEKVVVITHLQHRGKFYKEEQRQ